MIEFMVSNIFKQTVPLNIIYANMVPNVLEKIKVNNNWKDDDMFKSWKLTQMRICYNSWGYVCSSISYLVIL